MWTRATPNTDTFYAVDFSKDITCFGSLCNRVTSFLDKGILAFQIRYTHYRTQHEKLVLHTCAWSST